MTHKFKQKGERNEKIYRHIAFLFFILFFTVASAEVDIEFQNGFLYTLFAFATDFPKPVTRCRHNGVLRQMVQESA